MDSVGVWPKRLPFATSPTIIKTFRHALSLDERRVKFKATPWNRPNAKEAMLGVEQVPTRVLVNGKVLDDDKEWNGLAEK